MKAPLSYLPAVPAALGMMAGILADSLGAGFASVGVCSLLFIVLYLRHLHYPALIFLMVSAGGVMSMSHHPTSTPKALFVGQHTFVGKVIETNEGYVNTSYIVKVTRADNVSVTPFLSAVTVNSVSSPHLPGSIIEYTARLRPMERKEEVPHETDYTKFMVAEGIASRCFVNDTLAELSTPYGLNALSNRARNGLYNAIVNSPVDGPTAAFLVASMLGDRRFIFNEEISVYRDTGVAHILALSGLHVGIIASILGLIMFPLRLLRRGMHIGNLITAIIIWMYAVIAGFTPSIIRAAVMITVFIAARMIQRGTNAFNSLSLSIIVILCINPRWLFTPGFQLSVSAVASILMFGRMIPDSLRRRPLLWYAANLTVIPVAAMLGTGIISAYYFNVFPAMFIVGNIITGILFPFILGGGLILAAFTTSGISFNLLGWTVDSLHRIMRWSISALSSIEGSMAGEVYFSAWVILPYIITIILLAASIRYRKKIIWTMTGTMAMTTLITAALTGEHPPMAELYIPSSLRPTSVIMRVADQAWLYECPSARHGSTVQEDANRRYRRFLLSRGCGDSFIPITDSLNHTTFKVHNSMIVAMDKTIAIVGTRMPDIASGSIHVDYAMICDGYKGSVMQVLTALHPDTLLMGPDIHPSRRARLMRQCGDSIPYRNLARESFSIIR